MTETRGLGHHEGWTNRSPKVARPVKEDHLGEPQLNYSRTPRPAQNPGTCHPWLLLGGPNPQHMNLCKWVPHLPKAKVVWKQPIGELVPMEIPERPWKIITMDFIGLLPESWGSNMILNMVDRHSKLLYSLPCHNTITAEGVAQLFQKEVWHHKGIPTLIGAPNSWPPSPGSYTNSSK